MLQLKLFLLLKQKVYLMFTKIKEYWQKSQNLSTVNSILEGYKEIGDTSYSQLYSSYTQLYEANIRLALMKEKSYHFDERISKLKNEPFTQEYPEDIIRLRKLFSDYKDPSGANLLHKLARLDIPDESLKLWFKLLPKEKFLELDDCNFSPLLYSIYNRKGWFPLLEEAGIKFKHNEMAAAFIFVAGRKGLKHIRFAIHENDIKTVKYFYDKHPKLLNVNLRTFAETPLCTSIGFMKMECVNYFLSKGCDLNSIIDKEKYVDDLITIVNVVKDWDKFKETEAYHYLKKSLSSEVSKYKFVNSTISTLEVCMFDEKKLEIFYDLCPDPEIRTASFIDELVINSAFFNKPAFLEYSLKEKLPGLDIQEALKILITTKQSTTELIVNFLGQAYSSPDNLKHDLESFEGSDTTMLHLLCQYKTIEPSTVEWFKKNGLNIFLKNKDGECPFDYLEGKSKEVANQLYIIEYINKEKEELEKIMSSYLPPTKIKKRL